MKKARFTLYTVDYPPNRGGIALYLYELVQASNGGILVYSDVQRWFWGVWPVWVPFIFKMRREKANGREILVSHVIPLGTSAMISKWFGGPEYNLLFHGLDLRMIKSRWKRSLLKKICASANGLFVNSKSTKKDLRNLIGNCDPVILYPSVSNRTFTRGVHIEQEAEEEAPCDTDNKIIILSVARLVSRKGIDNAILAVGGVKEKMRDMGNEIRYVVIGEGEDRERLEKIAEQQGVAVEFLGEVSEYVKAQWMNRADIFLLPVRDEGNDVEGFGVVFLETASAGVPSIVGRSGGAIEAVQDGKTGILVDPMNQNEIQDAIIRLANDADLRVKMGREGKEWAKTFSWRRNWEKLSTPYGTLVPDPTVPDPVGSGTGNGGRVSVVIPCFNHAYVLRRTLRGLLEQTKLPYEILVVDDGSSDHPEKVVFQFQDWLPIRYTRVKRNMGAPFARNFGADQTDGEYILFLDADAELVPEALEKMKEVLDTNSEIAFVYSNFKWGSKIFNGIPFDEKSLKTRNYIHTSSLLRRSEFLRFDESLKKFQDWDLWLTMVSQGKKGLWVDSVLYTIEPRGKEGMSRWLPRIMHKIPWEKLGIVPEEIRRYREAERIVKSKHELL